MPTERSVPAIVNLPLLEDDVGAAASIMCAAIFLPLSMILSAAITMAEPASCAEREPNVPMPIVTTSVSP